MNGLISFENFALTAPQSVSREILALNEYSREYGLVLSEEDATELSDTRNRALVDNERLEIGVGAVAEIIKRFSQSKYVNADNYPYVLNEVTEIFYYIKTETDDQIGDGDLVEELFRRFELSCRGSVELLLERETERIIRKVTSGDHYEKWYGREDGFDGMEDRDAPTNVLREEYDEDVWSEEEAYLDEESYEEDDDIEAELNAFDDYFDWMAEEDNGEYYIQDEENRYDKDDEEDEEDEF